jgi:hypothetical protein
MKRLAITAHLLLALIGCNRAPDAGAHPATSTDSSPAAQPTPARSTSASEEPAVASSGTTFVAAPASSDAKDKFNAAVERGEAKARKTQPWADIGTGTVQGGAIANVGERVWRMHFGFNRCVRSTMQERPNIKKDATITLVAAIGARGEVLRVAPREFDDVPGMLASCLAKCVEGSAFEPPTGGAATVVIPLTIRMP